MSAVVTKNNLVQVYTKQEAAIDSRTQLLSSFNGVLATTMRDTLDLGGYPFGSVVPFCLNEKGAPIFLISDLAQHTKNINLNSKASLMIHNTHMDNIQKGWRLTIIGDIVPIDPAEYSSVAARYERYYAESREYHEVHDFNFYVMDVKKYRYINGFGMIHWVDKDAVMETTPFSFETELEMITHMDEDHYDTMLRFLQEYTEIKDHNVIKMTRIDQYGFVIAVDETFHRFFFTEEAKTPNDVRLHFVKLAKNLTKNRLNNVMQ